MTRKILAVFMALIMGVSMLPNQVFAEEFSKPDSQASDATAADQETADESSVIQNAESNVPKDSSKPEESGVPVESSKLEESSVPEKLNVLAEPVKPEEASTLEEPVVPETSSIPEESNVPEDSSVPEVSGTEEPYGQPDPAVSLDLAQFVDTEGQTSFYPEDITADELLAMEEFGVMPLIDVNSNNSLYFTQIGIGYSTSMFYGGYSLYGDWDGDGNYFNDLFFDNGYDVHGGGSPSGDWRPNNGSTIFAYSSEDTDYRISSIYNTRLYYRDWRNTSANYGNFSQLDLGNHFKLRWVYASGYKATLAYCIDANGTVNNYNFTTKAADSSEYMSYLGAKNSGNQLKLLKLITHFGAQAESKTNASDGRTGVWKTINLLSPYADDVKAYLEGKGIKGNIVDWYVATNALLWETVEGIRIIGADGLSTLIADGTNGCANASCFRDALEGTPAGHIYDWIVSKVNDSLKLPSFTASSASGVGSAQTVNLTWNASENAYTAIVTDTNKAAVPDSAAKTGINLSSLAGKGITITYLGNYKYKFSSPKAVTVNATNIAYPDETGSFGGEVKGIYVLEGAGAKQSAVVGADTTAISVAKYVKVTSSSPQKVTLKKSINSTCDIYATHPLYSLKGAVYGIYSDAACTKELERITTDASGSAVSAKTYEPGTILYFKEITAPPGYKLSTATPYLTVSADSASNVMNVKDAPVNDPNYIMVYKVDSKSLKRIPISGGSLEDARFKFEYFANYDRSGTPYWTGTFKTGLNGALIFATEYLVDGTCPFEILETASGKEILFPLGSFRISETVAPTGYTVSSNVMEGTITQPTSGGAVKTTLTAGTHTFLVELEDGSYGYPEEAARGNIIGKKVDQSGNALPGVGFTLYTSDGKTKVTKDVYGNAVTNPAVSDTTGSFGWKDLPLGTYVVKETDPLPTHASSGTTSWTVTLSTGGQTVRVGGGNIVNWAYGAMHGYKAGNDGTTPIGGVEFTAYSDAACTTIAKDKDGAELHAVTDNTGYFSFDLLWYGTYYVKESKTKEGYMPNNTVYTAVVDDASLDVALNNGDKILNYRYGSVKGFKRDDAQNPLQGVIIGVFDAAGNEMGRSTTNKDGWWYVSGLPYEVSGTTYYVKEIQGLDGYETFDDSIEFTISAVVPDYNMESRPIINRRYRGNVSLTKVDGEYPDHKLSGAVFEVYNSDMAIKVGELTESADEPGTYYWCKADEIASKGLPFGSFYVVETQSPEDYRLDSTHYAFTIDQNGETESIHTDGFTSVLNQPKTAGVKIIKVLEKYEMMESAEAVPITNIHFHVTGTAKTGQTVDFTVTMGKNETLEAQGHTVTVTSVVESDSTGYIQIEGLRLGEYQVEEVISDELYAYVAPEENPQTLILTEDGQTGELKFENLLRRGTVTIVKHAADDNRILLAGATLELWQKDYVRQWETQLEPDQLAQYEQDEKGYYQWVKLTEQVTDTQGQAVFERLVVGDYRIIETKAPEGYQLLSGPVDFSLPYGEAPVWNTELTQLFYLGEQPIFAMPSSGGIGSMPFVLVGMTVVLIGAAAGFFLLKGCKKKEQKQ